MKTPREILLERHRAAEPKLDTIRERVVKIKFREGRRVAVPKIRVAGTATLPFLIWRELFLPSRRIWAGLAACWIFLALVNLSMDRHSHARIAVASATPEMIQSYRQQERLLAELIGGNEPRVADAQRKFLPQPRSGRRAETLVG